MGKISINKMKFQASHGAYKSEKNILQVFFLSVSFDFDFEDAAKDDDLNKTINYAEIVDLCTGEMLQKRSLLESLVYGIAKKIKSKYEGVSNILVELEKPQVQMGIALDGVNVSYYLK